MGYHWNQPGGNGIWFISVLAVCRRHDAACVLAAFVLAMGMLVDNAIVIIDGILVDLKAGKPRMER